MFASDTGLRQVCIVDQLSKKHTCTFSMLGICYPAVRFYVDHAIDAGYIISAGRVKQIWCIGGLAGRHDLRRATMTSSLALASGTPGVVFKRRKVLFAPKLDLAKASSRPFAMLAIDVFLA